LVQTSLKAIIKYVLLVLFISSKKSTSVDKVLLILG
jgi:hypothetical protein